MTKQDPLPTETSVIEQVPLDSLTLSDLNPRKTVSEAHIDTLAASIARFGLIQNLAGLRQPDGRVEIVAGGCRLRALQQIVAKAETPSPATVPVRLTEDPEEAAVWASAENAAREALTPADEIRAFGAMAAKGASVADIALAFAVSEARVYQRLALAALPQPVLDALAAGEITLGAAKAFTLSQDAALTQKLLDQIKDQPISEAQLKSALNPDAVSNSDRRARFVGQEAYEAAGGSLTRDLFSDAVYFADPGLLDDLFAKALEAERTALIEDADWLWAEAKPEPWLNYYEIDQAKLARVYPVAGDLTEDEAEDYDTLAEMCEAGVLDATGEARLAALQAMLDGEYTDDQKAVSGCFVVVNQSGRPEVTAGLVRPEDKTAAIKAGVLTAPARPAPAPKSPYSQKLTADMQAIRLAAVQAALLAKPELVLDLLGFGASEASGSFETVFGLRLERPSNAPSVEDGFAREPRLDHGIDATAYWSEGTRVEDLTEAFNAFRAEGKKARNAHITEAIARSLPYQAGGDAFFDQIAAEAGADIRKHWTPTAENFFARVSADHLTELLCAFLDCDARDARVMAFSKLKKAEKAEKMEKLIADPVTQKLMGLTSEQKQNLAVWVPDCL